MTNYVETYSDEEILKACDKYEEYYDSLKKEVNEVLEKSKKDKIKVGWLFKEDVSVYEYCITSVFDGYSYLEKYYGLKDFTYKMQCVNNPNNKIFNYLNTNSLRTLVALRKGDCKILLDEYTARKIYYWNNK